MDRTIFQRIMDYTSSQLSSEPHSPALFEEIGEAERVLGFPIPTLLKDCYVRGGNGGFGPGYGIIGVEGGHASDYGNIVETYEVLKHDQESEGREWPSGLLPFCEWGCNTYSCVDCLDLRHPIYKFEDFAVTPQGYTLDKFFELWLIGADILAYKPSELDWAEFINPFTEKKEIIARRQP